MRWVPLALISTCTMFTKNEWPIKVYLFLLSSRDRCKESNAVSSIRMYNVPALTSLFSHLSSALMLVTSRRVYRSSRLTIAVIVVG